MSEEKKKFRKKHAIILGIVVGVIFILLVSFFAIARSPTTPAYLNIESGEVQVNLGSGWIPAVDGMELGLDDSVRTLDDSNAILVLYESIIVNLKPNTEVKIADLAKDHIKIKQDSGTTWNKFTKLAGINSYEVETPNTVATVRGTEFEMTMDSLIVGSGTVDFSSGKGHLIVNKNMKARLVDGKLVQEDLTPEEKARIIENKRLVLKSLRLIREREINKHPHVYNLVKSFAHVTDEEAKIKIQKMDWGYADEDSLIEKSPTRIESIEKFVSLTKEVKKEKKELQSLGYEEPKPKWLVERLQQEKPSEAKVIAEGSGEQDPEESAPEIKPEARLVDDKQVVEPKPLEKAGSSPKSSDLSKI